MAVVPPRDLRALLHDLLQHLLEENPMATASESYVQHQVEFALIHEPISPRYFLRIGINYHGALVQHVLLDASGRLVGWNPSGDALGIGSRAKVLLAGHTIFPRLTGEHMMADTKVGGGSIAPGIFVRIEFKVRGWLGKTKNLDGKQLEKDLDLLLSDKTDLLVIALSETAHRKWRGEGASHHVARRTGITRFQSILADTATITGSEVKEWQTLFEGQMVAISCQRAVGAGASTMPEAEHYITLVWRPDADPAAVP
jgi:hypothetical protein